MTELLQPQSGGSLVLENIVKVFEQGKNAVRAVDGVNLNIEGSEFVTLLGPSGCGKTTTLRLIAGFEFPTSGKILLDNKEITNEAPNQRPMAMVFQSYALFPHMSVFDNVAYGLQIKKLREAEIRESVEIVLHLMNLAGMEKRYPNQLSGGQQQRVALARAMVMKPKVLLFDEPLSNLDAKLRAQMRIEIRRLQQRLGIASVYVTHDQVEAMSLSDRVVVMNQGKIEQVGSPQEIYQRPSSVFVADFIGRANFIPVLIEKITADLAEINLFGQLLKFPVHPSLTAGQDAYAVIRPEAVRISGQPGAIMGQVKTAIYLGSSVEYEVEIGENMLVVIDNDLESATIFPEGSPVSLDIQTNRSYLLPIPKER